MWKQKFPTGIFESVVKEADEVWNKELGRIKVETAGLQQAERFSIRRFITRPFSQVWLRM